VTSIVFFLNERKERKERKKEGRKKNIQDNYFNNKMDINLYIWMAVAIIGNATLVIMTKYFSEERIEYMVIPYMISILTTYAFLKVFQHGPTHTLYSILVILTLIVAIIGGYFFLKEKISMTNIFGIGLGIGAIYLLSK